MQPNGLLAVFDENRSKLLRYFRAHGAGDSADDCVQELWIKISATHSGPLGSPLGNLYRAATNLMIDRHRAETQSRRRDLAWTEGRGEDHLDEPSAEQRISVQQQLDLVAVQLKSLPPRALAILNRHRIDGLTQREIAAEYGVSTSTVESDLRQAYKLLADLRKKLDEE